MNYKFTFTETETNYILNALGVKPFVEVVGLISNMQKQISDQQKSKEENKTEETLRNKIQRG